MIDFDDIDKRLVSLGKDRIWLAEQSGYRESSVREALAPNSTKRSARLQQALSEAIEKEEAAQKDGPIQLSHVTLRITTDELNVWARAYKDSDADSFEDWTIQAIRNAMREDLENQKQSGASPRIVEMPSRREEIAKPVLMAAAGSPINAETIEEHKGGNTIAIRISGLSMDPLFPDGSVVTALLKHACRSDKMKRGLIYLVSYEGGLTVKRYNTRPATEEEKGAGISYVSPRDHKAKVRILESVNPAFPEIVIKTDLDWIGWIDPKNPTSPK